MNEHTHVLPFGRHRGQAPSAVPSDYLLWLLRKCNPSSGLRSAITDTLRSRGVEVEAPTPKPPPTCRRCGCLDLVVSWHEIRGGRRAVRADCQRCGRFVGMLSETPDNVAKADAVQPAAPLLDVLTRAEDEGVALVVLASEVHCQPWQRASAELRQLVRQSQHSLLRHLRREPARAAT
jgi:uncharacterized protein (DUF3820 family)